MDRLMFNLHSNELLNISSNDSSNILDLIVDIENIIPSIKIYIFDINISKNIIYEERLKECVLNKNKLINILKNDTNNDIYINCKNENIDKIDIYPLSLHDEIYGFIYANIDNNTDVTRDIIELINSLLIRNIERFYNNELNNQNSEINSLYKEVTNGIRKKEFKFVYQPKFNIKSGKIIGAEALIRWYKNDGNIIYPNDFISKLEDNKLIYLLDYYTIEECLNRLYTWNKLYEKNIIPISINLSKSTLMKVDFIKILKQLIDRYNINLKYLEFEITERENTNYSIEEINNRIKEVRNLGIKISLDDFGAGYANLLFSMNTNLDIIKIDKSIVDEIGINEKVDYFLSFIIDLANKNNIELVAEGIETEEQLEFLICNGYELGQGYYLSKPIDIKTFEKKYLCI